MAKDKDIWNKVFDIRLCPLHFWRSKHPEEQKSDYNCNLEIYCCLSCPRKKLCKGPICKFPAIHCDSKDANFSLEELEEGYKKHPNYFGDFVSYLFQKRIEDASKRSQKGIQ